MPAAPLRVAKMQDVRCAPRSCGTIAPLSHFCSAGRLRRGFFPFYRFFLEPPDAVFALHDSRVQISWRKLAIPSLRSLRGFESLNRRHRRRKANFATTLRSSESCLHVCLRLLFASQKCKTFAVLLVPAELSHRSLIFAPRGGFAVVSFLFIVSSSNPLTLFSPCTTPACRSVGENSLFRRALRSLRGFESLSGSPPKVFSVGLFQAPENASSRGVFFRPVWGHDPRALCALSAQPK